MEILLSGLSFYYAAVATATLAHSAIMAVDVAVTMAAIAVSGLSFFSSSAVADVAAVTDSANSIMKVATVFRRHSLSLVFLPKTIRLLF